MRYPVGTRLELGDAVTAAVESARLTKLRYRVEIGHDVDEPWQLIYIFLPAIMPPPEPFTNGVML